MEKVLNQVLADAVDQAHIVAAVLLVERHGKRIYERAAAATVKFPELAETSLER